MESRYDYVLVGGGLACVWAAQTIREHDKQGKIVIIGGEPHPPYDRPPLSKNFLTNDEMSVDDPYSKFDDFYPKNQIELHTKTQVTKIDRNARTVTLADGTTFQYEKLLIATGARPRSLNVPGMNRIGVFLLRTIEDALQIRTALRGSQRAVIVGAGYLGMEVAASARERGLDVTVVEPQGHPWAKFASEKLGRWIQSYYERNGIKFLLHDEAVAFEGDGESGPVHIVRTKSGQQLPTDLVVVGVGVELNNELAREAGLEIGDRGGIKVNEFLQTADPHIWAAGDVALFKDIALNKEWHAEHFLNAKWQGQAVGAIMAGQNQPYNQIPYFFSDFLDLHMILRGDPQGGKNSIFTGDTQAAEFTELYYDDTGRLRMGVSISHDEKKLDGISDTLERLIRAGVNVQGREGAIQTPDFDLNSLT
ncbi:MAG TPA: FAD/NAD(P)-binding oxidoreductase [Chthonomonadaceae bacterium]|nr:FAD/NAD(P)-binding oxidoreductase [Chthonomonadaceae bacterium]